jgi:hypothetical protein
VAIGADVGVRWNVLIALYAVFPGSFVMVFIRPMGSGVIKVYSAGGGIARRRLCRPDETQYYFLGQSRFRFWNRDIDIDLAFAHRAQAGFPGHAVFDLQLMPFRAFHYDRHLATPFAGHIETKGIFSSMPD